MRTFVHKQKPTQQTKSSNSARPGRAFSAQSREVRSILHLQHTIGNHAVQRLLQSNVEELHPESVTPASTRFGHNFSRMPIFSPSPIQVQPKLTVSAPGDMYEQKADRVADQVMRTSDWELQSACTCGGGCPKCQAGQPVQEHEQLQANHAQAGYAKEIALRPIFREALSLHSRPLDAGTRAFMEPRFGHDFSRVRVHTNHDAVLLARRFRARAFTTGYDIFFGNGQYSPDTACGRQLIAHELAHIAQKVPIIARQSDGGTVPAPEIETRGPLWQRAREFEPELQAHIPRTPPVTGWGTRVLLTIGERTEARRDRAYLQLINEALAPDRNRFPGLRLPVTGIRTEAEAHHGGVYFALGKGHRPGQGNVLRAVTITRPRRRGRPQRVFIRMNGAALDPDAGPDFTRRVLNHEYVHFVQNTQGLLMQRPACRATWRYRLILGNPNREVVATSTTFARFFGTWADRSPAGSTEYPDYLLEDLALLSAYFTCAEETVRGPAVARIAAMAPGRMERRQHLLNLLREVRDSALPNVIPNVNLSYSDDALARIATAIGVSLERDPRLPVLPRGRTPLFDINQLVERSHLRVRERILESAP